MDRYDRQWRVPQIGKDGQEKLRNSKVAVIGLGALGSVSADLLVRAGVGSLILVDRDFLEDNNLQRQVLYDENDVRENLPKAIAAAKKLKSVNTESQIRAIVSDVNAETIAEILANVDLVVDGTDNFETRYTINDYCVKNNIPWIYGGAIQTRGVSYAIRPNKGPCLRCLFDEPPVPEEQQTCDQAGILAPVSHIIASFQVMEAFKILVGAEDAVDKRLWQIDLWTKTMQSLDVTQMADKPCPTCLGTDFPYLEQKIGTEALKLCGRNAVQIYNWQNREVNFRSLAAKLEGQVDVEYNEYVMNILPPSYRITVFQNGRVIIKGTEDPGQAKSLYAKYIGQ